MADVQLTKFVQSTFSLYGLAISRQLSITVAKHLQSLNEIEPEKWLTQLVEQILTQNLKTPHVELEHIKLAIRECLRPESHLADTETTLNIVDAFEVPKVKYDICKKKFVLEKYTPDLYPDADFKTLLYKDRLELLWHRTLKHPLFTPLKFGEVDENRSELTPIEFLLSERKTTNVCVMGLLSQLTEGQYYLEDTGGAVKVDFKGAIFESSLVMEGSIILAQGKYSDEVLHLSSIDFPPIESSESSRALFGEANTFGGSHPTSLKYSEKLKIHENSHFEETIIFISEFWLDDNTVLDKFATLLSGFSDTPPKAVVLCGHFLSFPPTVSSPQQMKEGFKKLANIVMRYPSIIQCSKFILVPGPYDVGAPKILPRGSLPKFLVEDFLKVMPGTLLATNPCRIQYCTKEIVVLREDMLSKFCRNTLRFPKTGEVYEHYAKSIIRQSHLAPLSMQIMPIYWKHDQALQIYPTPDLIVVADDFKSYKTSYGDCKVINPGSFAKSNFSFFSYIPAENMADECCVGDEEEEISNTN